MKVFVKKIVRLIAHEINMNIGKNNIIDQTYYWSAYVSHSH